MLIDLCHMYISISISNVLELFITFRVVYVKQLFMSPSLSHKIYDIIVSVVYM